MTPTAKRTYDVVVIGGGPTGENVADRAGRTGLTVALVEAELVGGECSYWACMPSKTLLRPGAVLDAARAVPGVTGLGEIDPVAVLAWRDRVVGDWDDAGQVNWLNGVGMDLVRGHGRIAGERLVEVETTDGERVSLEARCAVVVASGSAPILPDIPGLADVEPWSSRDATGAKQVPESLAIVGGGVIACEMATAYADLGARVTLLSRGTLLARDEPFAGEAVAASLVEMGVDVRLSAAVDRAERSGDGVRLMVSDGGQVTAVTASKVLVAAGRAPRTADIGVDVLGLRSGAALDVDESMAVRGVPGVWLYAAGDVTGRAATTHHGKYEARVAGDVIATRFGSASQPSPSEWSKFTATADRLAATQAVFTRPEVASVGLTERAARVAGMHVRVVRASLASTAGATVHGPDYDGVAQIVVDADREVIVGATFVGPDAAELLHAATVAVVGEVPLWRLWHAVPAYPTVSEVWLRLLEGYGL